MTNRATRIYTSVSDAQWTAITGIKINRAAQRRKEAAERAAVIEALGWEPEGNTPEDKYVGTTQELKQDLEARTAL